MSYRPREKGENFTICTSYATAGAVLKTKKIRKRCFINQ